MTLTHDIRTVPSRPPVKFRRIEDGRLEEEQPGVPWAPPGGERVAFSSVEVEQEQGSAPGASDDEIVTTVEQKLVPEQQERLALEGRDIAMAILQMTERVTSPDMSVAENLEAMDEYLGSQDFIEELRASFLSSKAD